MTRVGMQATIGVTYGPGRLMSTVS